MLAAVLALTAAGSWGVGDFLGGVSSRRLGALTVVALSELAGLAAIGVVLALSRPDAPGAGSIAWGVAAGLAGVIGLGCLYRGMAVGAIGVVAPLSSAAALIPVVVGIATGERPGIVRLAGVAVELVGVVLASREPAPIGARLAAGVPLALLAALGFGLYFVFIDRATEGGALWAVAISRGAASLLALTAALGLTRLRGARSALPTLAAVGLFDVGANGMLALALRHGLVSLVSVLSSLYPVVTLLLARTLLSERLARSQATGVALALAGAVLISAG